MFHEMFNFSLLVSGLVLSAVLYPSPCQGEISGEYLFFPNIDVISRSNLQENSSLDENEITYGIDFFVTLEYEKLRFLGEFLLTEEGPDMERFAAGWMFGENTIWLGRNHNPIGYWNTQYHHGSYLQTSISRPAITGYEHNGGILPMHLGGIEIEGMYSYNDQGLGYNLAVAAGPEFNNGLEEWHLIKPEISNKGITTTLNLFLEPVIYAPTRYGIYFNYTEIPAETIGVETIRQTSAGLYGNRESPPWRITGAAFYIHNRFPAAGGKHNDDFLSAYLQVEYRLLENWKMFGRLEMSAGDKGDSYLDLFPDFVRDRAAAGVRFDILQFSSLKMEFSGNRALSDEYLQIMLQWDAMF